MPGFHEGMIAAIMGAVAGVAVNAILASQPPSPLIFALYLCTGAGTVGIIDVMPHWSTSYLAGRIAGYLLMQQGGIVDPIEFVFYLIGGIAVIVARYR